MSEMDEVRVDSACDGSAGGRKSNFPVKISEILDFAVADPKEEEGEEKQGSKSPSPIEQKPDFIQWNASGTAIMIHTGKLEAYLKTDQSIFSTRNLKSFIRQLNLYGFENVTSQEKIRTAQNLDDDVMVYQHQHFLKNCPNLMMTIGRMGVRKQTKYIYCRSDDNYLKYKRQNDPCYKLIPRLSEYEKARMHLRAVLEKQKLTRSIGTKLALNSTKDLHEIIGQFVANEKETKNPIQMGAIAGYYGESVVEEDLIKFFGKHLPMYKPISEVSLLMKHT